MEIIGPRSAEADRILTAEALALLEDLERTFRPARHGLLAARADRRAALAAGGSLASPPPPRDGTPWVVPAAPPGLVDRRVEITGPAEPKMMINALNSGARVFMADFEDALSPTWSNLVVGQAAVHDAVRRTLAYDAPDGRPYRLRDEIATLVVRPRGWHLDEPRALVDGAPMSGSLFDAGLYAFWDAAESVERGSGPYLYLAKLEGATEAALWHDVLGWLEDRLGLPHGTFRTTVLIETLPAAFEMDGILAALGDHASALNAGRWDYLFSAIKTHRDSPVSILADRAQLTMTVPFMRAYTERLVRTCHDHGAHAIGGMAAFIPSRRDPEVNERALARVHADKEREAGDGFDGTWVAHPDLVPVAREEFDRRLGDRPNQLDRRRGEPPVEDAALLDLTRARRPRLGGRRPDERPGRAALSGRMARRERGGGDRRPHGGRRDGRDLSGPAVGLAAPRRDGRWPWDLR